MEKLYPKLDNEFVIFNVKSCESVFKMLQSTIEEKKPQHLKKIEILYLKQVNKGKSFSAVLSITASATSSSFTLWYVVLLTMEENTFIRAIHG